MKRLLCLCLFLLAACASPREVELTDAQLTALQPGKTTSAEIVKLFGEPSERRGAAQLVYAWTLGRTNSINLSAGGQVASGNIEVQRREIVLNFDGEVLKDIERNTLTRRSGYMSGQLPQ